MVNSTWYDQLIGLMSEERKSVVGTAASVGEMCIPDCKIGKKKANGKDLMPMIRCCCCMEWFHEACMKEKDLSGIWNCFGCRRMPSMIKGLMADLKALSDEFAAYKTTSTEAISQLSEQHEQSKNQNKDLQTKIDLLTKSSASRTHEAASAAPDSTLYSDVVCSSVKTALRDEKAKNDVIITRINENNNEQQTISNLCSKINFDSTPTDVMRLGKKAEGHNRPLKVTFTSRFDARAFCSRVNACKEDHSEIADIKVRIGKTRGELTAYKKNKEIVDKLNKGANERKEDISFSLRDNGDIWKFKKQDNKWTRVNDWTVPDQPDNSVQGNL